jgi:hypothetical protein
VTCHDPVVYFVAGLEVFLDTFVGNILSNLAYQWLPVRFHKAMCLLLNEKFGPLLFDSAPHMLYRVHNTAVARLELHYHSLCVEEISNILFGVSTSVVPDNDCISSLWIHFQQIEKELLKVFGIAMLEYLEEQALRLVGDGSEKCVATFTSVDNRTRIGCIHLHPLPSLPVPLVEGCFVHKDNFLTGIKSPDQPYDKSHPCVESLLRSSSVPVSVCSDSEADTIDTVELGQRWASNINVLQSFDLFAPLVKCVNSPLKKTFVVQQPVLYADQLLCSPLQTVSLKVKRLAVMSPTVTN